MDIVLRSLQRAGQDLFSPKMLSLVLWPMGVALVVWSLLAWWFGAAWRAEIAAFLAATPLQDLMLWAGAEWLIAYAAVILVVLLWLPAVYTTALLITSLALMPIIVDFVAERHYPGLERWQGGSFTGSLANGLMATAIYIAAWVVLLPLWLFAPFGAAVSLLLNAWFNQRLFLYDALAEHAGRDEATRVHDEGGWRLYGLATVLALLHFVPVLNFLAPVYMGLAFVHYALDTAQAQRQGMAT